LNGFQYLFRKYWSPEEPVRVVGYSPPRNGDLPSNFSFYSLSKRNYPATEWSSGVLQSLDKFIENGEEFFIMMLEDFWLNAPVNLEIINRLVQYLNDQPRNILRMDLTADRCQHKRFIVGSEDLGNCTVIRTSADAPYQMSFQAAIWNISLLRAVLRPYEDPWTSEIQGTARLKTADEEYVVLGTINNPLKYQPVYRSKRVSLDISKLSEEDQQVIVRRGWV
jgi:hypothetical protein